MYREGLLNPLDQLGGAGLSHRALRVTWAAGNRGRPCLPRPAPRPRPGQGLDCARSPAESRGGACCGPCVRGPRVTCPWAVCPLVACPHPPVFSGPRRTTQETREEVRASARHQRVQERGPSLAAGRHDLWPHAGRGSASPPLQRPAGVTDAAPAPAAPAAVICAPSRRRSHPRPLPGRTPQPGLTGAWSGGLGSGAQALVSLPSLWCPGMPHVCRGFREPPRQHRGNRRGGPGHPGGLLRVFDPRATVGHTQLSGKHSGNTLPSAHSVAGTVVTTGRARMRSCGPGGGLRGLKRRV